MNGEPTPPNKITFHLLYAASSYSVVKIFGKSVENAARLQLHVERQPASNPKQVIYTLFYLQKNGNPSGLIGVNYEYVPIASLYRDGKTWHAEMGCTQLTGKTRKEVIHDCIRMMLSEGTVKLFESAEGARIEVMNNDRDDPGTIDTRTA